MQNIYYISIVKIYHIKIYSRKSSMATTAKEKKNKNNGRHRIVSDAS